MPEAHGVDARSVSYIATATATVCRRPAVLVPTKAMAPAVFAGTIMLRDVVVALFERLPVGAAHRGSPVVPNSDCESDMLARSSL